MAVKEIPASEAGRAPGAIFERVARGETILLTRYGRPYVLLSPPREYQDQTTEESTETG